MSFLGNWKEAFRPIAKHLLQPLPEIYRDEDQDELDRRLATSVLADYASDDVEELVSLLGDADQKWDLGEVFILGFETVVTRIHIHYPGCPHGGNLAAQPLSQAGHLVSDRPKNWDLQLTCRETPYDIINRSKVISDYFGRFEVFVHFCSMFIP